MIELYDAARLQRKVDRSLLLAGGLLAVVMLGLGAHSFSLHTRQQALGKEFQALELKLKAIPEQRVPSTAMLEELQRQVAQWEAQAGPATASSEVALPASGWMAALADLASTEVSLTRVEIDRNGSAQVEGLARSAQGVSALTQRWAAHEALQTMRTQTLELKQEKAGEPLLKFHLLASVSRRSPSPSQTQALEAQAAAPAASAAPAVNTVASAQAQQRTKP